MKDSKYPFKLTHDLDRHLRIKQARLTVEHNKAVTLIEVYKDMASYMGVSENAVALIKANNYNPSLIVAMSMAEYLETTVDDLFTIERVDDK